MQCDNLNTLLRIVVSGDAFTITTRAMPDKTNFEKELSILPLEVPGMKTDYSIFSMEGSTPIHAISRLHDLFVEVTEEVMYK